jgi:hypothetical protein
VKLTAINAQRKGRAVGNFRTRVVDTGRDSDSREDLCQTRAMQRDGRCGSGCRRRITVYLYIAPPGGAGASGAHTVTRSLARSPARVSCRFWAANEQLRKRGVLCRSEGWIRDWSFLPVGLTTATGHGLALCEGSTGAKAICGSGSVKPSTGGSGTSAPPNSGQSFG